MAQEEDIPTSPKKRDPSPEREFDFSPEVPDSVDPEDRPKKKRKKRPKDDGIPIGRGTDESTEEVESPPLLSIILDYVLFRRMITPIIIQFFFWATAFLLVCTGIYEIFDGLIPQHRPVYSSSGFIGETHTTTYSAKKESDLREAFIGFLTMSIGPIVMRIYCEILILFFRMNETLTDIRSNTAPK